MNTTLLKMLYGCMISLGSIKYPEAGKLLNHYLYGKGEPLVLSSTYIKNSPVITRNLLTMQVGQTRQIQFRQQDDWRLSYALNGFRLTKTKSGGKLLQYYSFSNKQEIYTRFKLGSQEFTLSDNEVHKLKPTPFWASCSW